MGAGAVLAAAGTVHAAINAALLRTPTHDPPVVTEPVSLLLPVRDEAHRVGRCLSSLRSQHRLRDCEILVLDDSSTDGTADVVRAVAGTDPRVRLLTGTPLREGWLGKPHACAALADAARGSVLVFVDADVRLAPHAAAAAVTLLRWSGLDLVSPYPQQQAVSVAERLTQPLLQWSWLTFLPLRVAERSSRPSLAAANGQFLVVDADAYRRAGGHAAVRDVVAEDIGLLRAVKRAGGRGVVVDGTALATCRMYTSWPQVRDGYAKWLASAFGTRPRTVAGLAVAVLAYVVPPVAALVGSRRGLAGYAAAVAGRALTGRRTGARAWPDALAHPASVALAAWLTIESWRRRRNGSATWKGRPVRWNLR